MKNIIADQIQGLKSSIISLRETEKLFIRANTLQEQADKARSAIDKLEDELLVVKEKKAALKQKRADLLKSALDPLAKAITSLLPRGEAVVSLEDSLFIGWKHEERLTPYLGLSGGEKVFFDGALSAAMLRGDGQKIIVLEGGELDDQNLAATLGKIVETHPEAQLIVNTWYCPGEVPSGWKVVELA